MLHALAFLSSPPATMLAHFKTTIFGHSFFPFHDTQSETRPSTERLKFDLVTAAHLPSGIVASKTMSEFPTNFSWQPYHALFSIFRTCSSFLSRGGNRKGNRTSNELDILAHSLDRIDLRGKTSKAYAALPQWINKFNSLV